MLSVVLCVFTVTIVWLLYIYIYVSCLLFEMCILHFHCWLRRLFFTNLVYTYYTVCVVLGLKFFISQIQQSKIPTKEHRPRKSTYFLNTAELQLNKSKLLKKNGSKIASATKTVR